VYAPVKNLDVAFCLVDGYCLFTCPCESFIVHYTIKKVNNFGPRNGIIGIELWFCNVFEMVHEPRTKIRNPADIIDVEVDVARRRAGA
jgi:hypothetical protein